MGDVLSEDLTDWKSDSIFLMRHMSRVKIMIMTLKKKEKQKAWETDETEREGSKNSLLKTDFWKTKNLTSTYSKMTCFNIIIQ